MRMKSKYKILCFCLFAALVFLNLGIWQTNRHYEKQELKKFIDFQMSSPTISLNEKQEDFSFRRVSSKGEFLTYVLISGRYFYSEEGYGLIALFKPGNSDFYYVVDRGWISKKRDFDLGYLLNTEVNNDGILVPFEEFTEKESKPLKEEGGVAVFSYMDPSSIELHFKKEFPEVEISDFVILHGLQNKKGELIKETDDKVISWWVLPQGSLPHLGYAITWFGLMLTSLFFSVVSLRNNNPPRGGSGK